MKLIYGRAGSGKTYYCMNQIKENIAKAYNGPLLYIVPEQFTFEAEKELIRVIEKPGIINVEVLSFKRLCHRIFNELGYKGNNIGSSGKSMLIFFILNKLNDKLKLLKNAVKNPGIVDTVADLISEFKRYNITPEMLKSISISNEQLKMKLEDMYLIYNEYESTIKNKYIDTDEELTILSHLIGDSTIFNGAKIWIDEFNGFTPQEYEVIKKLAQKSNITVTLTLDNSKQELFILNRKTANKLKQIEDCEEIYLSNSLRFNNPELKHLEKNIFKYPHENFEGDVNDIKISSCSNTFQEIERVAIDINKLVRDRNFRYQNIAILSRNLDSYKNLISMIFNVYNIPYFLDDKRELDSEPLIQLVLSLFDICIKNFSYESVFNYLKTGLTNIRDINEIDIIENYVLKYGIRGSSVWNKEWKSDEEDLGKINTIRQNIITPIFEFKDSLNNIKTVKELVISLFEFLIKIGVYENIQNKIQSLKDLNNNFSIEIANENAQVWNIFINILDEIVGAIGDERISFEKFKDTLKIGITKQKIGLIPPSKDQVLIGNIDRTRNANVKFQFIIGVNDGIFPMAFSTEGFINDNDRVELFNSGIELAKDTKTLLFEENYNIYKALTTPSDSLLISYPISTLEGKSLRPSYLIKQILKMYPNLKENNFVIDDIDSDYINTPNATFYHLLKKLRSYIDGLDLSEEWKCAYQWFNNFENEKMESVNKGLDYTNAIEYADKKLINNLYGSNINSSVSRLEKFSLCPFSFFLKYGLNVKTRQIFKLETPDTGTFLHEVIDKFSNFVQENNMNWRDLEKAWCDEKVSEIVNDYLISFRNSLFNSSNRLKNLGLKLKRILKRIVWLIVLQIKNSEFDVIGNEVEFGRGKQYKEIELELDGDNKITLSGKIDRIDLAKTSEGKYIRIIDYKSSNKEIKLSDVFYGLQLQLLVYLDAASLNDFLPGGVLYLKLDDPIIKSKKDLTSEELEYEIMKSLRMDGLILANARLIKAMDTNMDSESSLINLSQKKDGTYGKMPVATEKQFSDLKIHIRKTLKDIGNEIMKGNIKNLPIKKKNFTSCDYCEYKTICRFDRKLGNEFNLISELKEEEVFKRISID
jgi:ATP-dependent helicase/nuclease subunit B